MRLAPGHPERSERSAFPLRARFRELPSQKISSTQRKPKAAHAGMGLFSLLLRWLTWPVAALCAAGALLFNLYALPVFGRGSSRAAPRRRDAARRPSPPPPPPL